MTTTQFIKRHAGGRPAHIIIALARADRDLVDKLRVELKAVTLQNLANKIGNKARDPEDEIQKMEWAIRARKVGITI